MVYTSEYTLDYPADAAIPNLLLDYNIGGRSHDSPAIIDGPTGKVVYTYASLRLSVRGFAKYLQDELGIVRGTVVGILDFNTVVEPPNGTVHQLICLQVHYPVYVHAVLAAGGVVCGLNPFHRPQVRTCHRVFVSEC